MCKHHSTMFFIILRMNHGIIMCMMHLCAYFHPFNLHWPRHTSSIAHDCLSNISSCKISGFSCCVLVKNTEGSQRLAYVQREEGWTWTMVGFNVWGLIYLQLPARTLHTHPSLSDCIVGVLCVSLQLKVLKEMKTDYSGTWAECLVFFNKGQEGNRKLSVSCQAIHWSYRILMGIVGKE